MITDFNWGTDHTHFYDLGMWGPFGNGMLSLFAVIGANNECYFNGNSFSYVEPALNLAKESFGIIELIANFDASLTNAYIGDEIRFTDTSIGNPTTWEWDFESDGIYDSFEQNPTHNYNFAGTYSVKLRITNDTQEDFIIKDNLITVEYIPPAKPQNVQINIFYPHAIISWSAVDTNINGDPITPDGYKVFYSNNGEDFFYLNTTTITAYFHNGAAEFSNKMFYRVVAYIDDSRE